MNKEMRRQWYRPGVQIAVVIAVVLTSWLLPARSVLAHASSPEAPAVRLHARVAVSAPEQNTPACLRPCTAASTRQLTLAGSDGKTWMPMDPALTLTVVPSNSCNALLLTSAALSTAQAGVAQDLAILVNGSPVASIESGGATPHLPRSAFVHTVLPMKAGSSYRITLAWKANKPTSGAIMAGAEAGPSASPTRLTALCRFVTSIFSRSISQSLTLTGSNGTSWAAMDTRHLTLGIRPSASCNALLLGNATLWTTSAGQAQDLGMTVNGALVAWKASGGAAANDPHAVLVQGTFPLLSGHNYAIRLVWRTGAPTGGSIAAAAGSRLSLLCVPSEDIQSVVDSQSLQLKGSDGTNWTTLDPRLTLSLTPAVGGDVILVGSADLGRAEAGPNPELGMLVAGGTYGAGQVLTWTEEGAAGAKDPSGATVQTTGPVAAGVTYTVSLVWKAASHDGGTLLEGAGAGQDLSPLGLAALVIPSQTQSLPPDPHTVAPPVNGTVASTVAATTQFLYTGNHPIQTGVAAGTINPIRAAVLRGKVLTRGGQPLSGVLINIAGHPELGQTESRADGGFDLAVNGGGLLTVSYAKDNYLPVQRQVQAPWQDYASLPDVVMIPYDPRVAAVDLTSSAATQVAQGSTEQDADGSRAATLLFAKGTTATMTLPGGGSEPLSTLHVRATEFTVGSTGKEAMPAPLPANSGYTYAADFSVDEAVVAGASSVQFSQPVPVYVQNFLGFPVGSPVPAGYYDRGQGKWIASQNGLVIKLLSVTGGEADLDVDGSGQPASSSAYAALGISDAERAKLASLYAVGTSLWRVPISHFGSPGGTAGAGAPAAFRRLDAGGPGSGDAPWDFNWPFGPPDDAKPPREPNPDKPNPDCQHQKNGSIIGCENQTMGEAVPLSGTPFSLHYQSERVVGRKAEISIPLSGNTVPGDLKRIDLEILIAGQDIWKSFPAAPNQSYTFIWDGKDAYGRTLQGSQEATIRLGYVYPGIYFSPPGSSSSGGCGCGTGAVGTGAFLAMPPIFGHFTWWGTPATGNRERVEVTLWQEWHVGLGSWDDRAEGLGGWSLSVHHGYDLASRVIYLGDGSRRSAQAMYVDPIQAVAGDGTTGCNYRGCFGGDEGPATQARLYAPSGIALAPDGSRYIADWGNRRIRRVDSAGVITTVAGGGTGCPQQTDTDGDNCPATQAQLVGPSDIALGPDGSLYISDSYDYRIRRVGPDGIITTVAGNGTLGFSGDNGPATQAQLDLPQDLALAPDGSLYFAEWYSGRIRRVGPDGIITTVAGGGSPHQPTDREPAAQAYLHNPFGVAVGPDGSLYITTFNDPRILRVGPDGIMTAAAGGGSGCPQQADRLGDGCPATQAVIGESRVTVGTDGSLYIADSGNNRIRRVGPDGIITTVAGEGDSCNTLPCGDGGAATRAQLTPGYLAMGTDGNLYVTDSYANRLRRVSPPFPGFSSGESIIPAADGSELHVFDTQGRHLRTLDALTNALRYQFSYDGAGRLSAITDGDGNRTTIQRDAKGNPTAIIAPGGQATSLTVDTNGYLASIADPAGDTYRLSTSSNGLLRTFADPRGNVHTFGYDDLGRLIKDQDPAGGSTTLSRTDSSNGYVVTSTDSLGRKTFYQVERPPAGGMHLVTTAPNGTKNGTKTDVVRRTDGTTITTYPDGTTTTVTEGPDPRWSMLAPIPASTTVATPSGLTSTTAMARTVSLNDPNNPFSLKTLTDTVTDDGRTYTTTYDGSSRTLTTTSPAGRKSITTLDGLGRVVGEQTGNLTPVGYTYDARGRLATVAQGTRTTSFAYNTRNELTGVTDPLTHTSTFTYDPAGRLQTETLPDGKVIAFRHDANGNLSSLTPPGRPAHTFGYTAIDQLASYTPPAASGSGPTSYVYNPDRSLASITQGDGSKTAMGYDLAGRLNTISLPGSQTESFVYSPSTGQLTTLTSPDGTLTLGHDGFLPTDSSWGAGAVTGSTHQTYDASLRLGGETVNGGNAVSFGYDNDSLLTTAGSLSLTRDPQTGFVTGSTLGSISTTNTYSGFGELSNISASFNSSSIFSEGYTTRDSLGRVTARTETIGGTTSHYTYTYDTLGRLTDVSQDGTQIGHYAYDANGNRIGYTGPDGATITGTYDAQDRLTRYGSITYTYSANGQLKSKTTGTQTTSYTYDALGNLKQVALPNGNRIAYLVDVRGNRIGKKVNGALQQGFLYGTASGPIAELNGNNQVVSRFVYGTNPMVPDYMTKGGNTYRLITDQLGSVRLVVDTSSGQIAQRLDYDVFGNVITDTNPGLQPFGFAGGLYDHDTGLVRFGARDYDPATGRWTGKDPIGFAGGDTNLYGYVLNDPLNWRDPYGFTGCPPDAGPPDAGPPDAGPPDAGPPDAGAFQAWQALSNIAQDAGFTVTGANETTGHNRNSPHYQGRAIDVRTTNQTDDAIHGLINTMEDAGVHVRDERTRPPDQPVWSGPHIHFDVPRGWQPPQPGNPDGGTPDGGVPCPCGGG